MFKNYLKIGARNFIRNKAFTLINVLGLTVGISACTLIFLLIKYELDFDNFHSKKDRIYRIVHEISTTSGIEHTASVPYPMGQALINEFPDLEAVVQIFRSGEYQIKYGDDIWNQEEVLFADSSFLKAFDFELLVGNPALALKNPRGLLITEKVLAEHFSEESPIGKIVELQNFMELEIVGIIKNPPSNSHLNFEMIVSFEAMDDRLVGGFEIDSWGTTLGTRNYVLLPTELDPEQFELQLSTIVEKYYEEEEAGRHQFGIQPLREIHFDQTYAGSNSGYTVDTKQLWILGFVAFFIISIACINFVNLSTAIAIKKSKEVGIRKVLGASKIQLVVQYLGEAFILSFVSMLLALGIVERILPKFNQFQEVNLNLNLLDDGLLLMYILAIITFVGFFSGIYPALVLSGYTPTSALKSTITSQNTSSLMLRKGLVTFQFLVSQILIIGTIIISAQMNYFRNKPLGFDKDFIITLPLNKNDISTLETFKIELLRNSNIKAASFGIGVPTSENNIGTSFTMEGSDDDYRIHIKAVDYDYLKTFGLELVAGDWYTNERTDSMGNVFVVNEATTKTMGYNDPEEAIGKFITIGLGHLKLPIIGVVKDFHMVSLHEAIAPVVMLQYPKLYFQAGLKISESNVSETLAFIESKWKQAFPGYIYDYSFLDQSLEENYENEAKTYTLFQIFSGISIFIGCMGLFGLVSFLVTQRAKEVGVRKVLGASVQNIVYLFSKDFVILIILAFIISIPITWYTMEGWLADFAYKINLSPIYFIIGISVTLFIALLTIGYQSIKAAIANPVNSLRSE